ncbi:MAG: MerR family transcriptional regulator [Candidatus Berkiellales bacterium]
MTQWYPKEFSKLTGVSVRTLHYYDKIGLLKPSLRLPNGFRLYSENDLLKLQQIIALKFFGFTLSQIHGVLAKNVNALEHFGAQRKILQGQIQQLQNADQTLGSLIWMLENNKSIHLDNIIQLIGDYRMTNEAKMVWGPDLTNDKQQAYQDALIKIGLATKEQIVQCNEKVKKWKKEKIEKIRADQDEVLKALAQAITQNLLPSDPFVQVQVRKHFETIQHFWAPTKESYMKLGQFYSENDDFKKFIKAYHPNLVEYLAKAMKIFAEQQLH